MELDEIDPERWAALEAATDDYIALPAAQAKFAAAAAALGTQVRGPAVYFPAGWAALVEVQGCLGCGAACWPWQPTLEAPHAHAGWGGWR